MHVHRDPQKENFVFNKEMATELDVTVKSSLAIKSSFAFNDLIKSLVSIKFVARVVIYGAIYRKFCVN